MKIILINSVVNNSSTGRIVSELSKMLTKQGVDNLILYGIGTASPELPAVRVESPIYIRWNVLKTRIFGRHSFYSKRASRRMIEYIKQFKPDVVHLHQMHGHYINIEMLLTYLSRNNIPVVWTSHDCWPVTGHCAHFDMAECGKWKTGCHHCSQLNTYPISLHDRSAQNWRDKKRLAENCKNLTMVTPSNWLKGILNQSYFRKHRIECIYNGVDRTVFKPRNSESFRKKYKIEDKHIIFSVYKRDISWGSFYKALNDLLSDDEVMVIAAADKALRRMLPDYIITLPYMTERELAEAYAAADVYINTTVQESFCMVAAEAISSGTPVIACNRTAIPEIVGECGEILEDFTPENVYSAIRRLRGKRIDCIERAERLFDKEKNYKRYMDLYRSLYEKNITGCDKP